MSANLAVRVFNVCVGDCIYVCVPDAGGDFHMLVDCGTRGGRSLLDDAIRQIKASLPPARARRASSAESDKWLDLLVVTHPDGDHINGFTMERFEGLRIGQIWLNPLMNSKHPQARQSHALMDLAQSAANALLERHKSGLLALDECTLERLGAKAADKKAFLNTLTRELDPRDCPRRYMCRDYADPTKVSQTQGQGAEFKFEKNVTVFSGFKDPDTKIRILAPEWDIDGTYLARASTGRRGLVDYRALLEGAPRPAAVRAKAGMAGEVLPINVSAADFRLLRVGMQQAAMSFVGDEDKLTNNTSVVLLLEWKGHRLLFTGDAECEEKTSSWSIMLDRAKPYLKDTVDFLKVGHHGSINATPLPEITTPAGKLANLVSKRKSEIVVSTKTGTYPGMPARAVMEELGKRAKNAKKYDARWGKQPERTDKEGEPYIEVLIPPA